MRQGQLVYVMGASGSGKDSLLQALRPRLRGVPVAFARRYITRPLSAKGERHIAVSRNGSRLWRRRRVHDGLAKPRPPVRHREGVETTLPTGRGARTARGSICPALGVFQISFPCLWKWTLPYFGRVCWRGARAGQGY
ncbi:MAG: hypothetical protein ACLSTO_01540 [Bilophila wadsworthia]